MLGRIAAAGLALFAALGLTYPVFAGSNDTTGSGSVVVQTLDGTWEGQVNDQQGKRSLVLHVSSGTGGTLATLDSPDRGAFGLPIRDLRRDGQKVEFTLPATGASYSGTLSADGSTISGAWTHDGQATPSSFARTSASSHMTLAQSAPFDPAARRAVVAELATAMRTDYVEPEVGDRAAARIEQALAAGDYDNLPSAVAFADRLTVDLAGVAHDKHLRVIAAGSGPPPGAAAGPPPPNDSGVVRADRLKGDIGYIEIIGFPPPVAFKGALDRAMSALEGTHALVIDMRRNHGGNPLGVAYLASFFVDEKTPVHVMDLLWRKPGTTEYRTEQDFTSPTPTSYLRKPVYVLTSSGTFSGGEEFCYDMQALKLAVLVGETTGGGANPGFGRPLGARLSMFLPAGKARSPITGTSWEGVGVIPDIAAPADRALSVALEKLGQTPTSGDIAALSQASLFQIRTTPLPGAEAALRRMIEDAARGQPDYDQLSPAFAEVVRSQFAVVQPLLAGMGPIQSISFRGPGMGGDSFEVRFANGAQIWSISLGADGKVDGALFGPVSPAPVSRSPAAAPPG